jgi:predicted dehydrogenase
MMTIGWLGCAHIHTPGFVKRIKERGGEVKVKAVWDHDAARARANAEALGSTAVSTADAVLSDPEIGAVVICSETDRHGDLVLAAALAGKHMFVEKPLGLGASDAWRMAKAIEKVGVLFQTGYFNRGAPVHRFLRGEIMAGHFGTITRARHSNCHKGSLAGWFDKEWRWMADPEVAGCGAYGDLGTHSLDILMWLFGDVARVAASIGVVTRRYGECDETGEGLIEFSNGVIATLAAGWVDVANPVRALVSGTEGHAVVVNNDLYYQSCHVEGADGKQPWTKLPEALPHAFDLFLDAVGGKSDVPLVTPSEAAARSAVMEALYAASKTRRWVSPKQPRSRGPSASH